MKNFGYFFFVIKSLTQIHMAEIVGLARCSTDPTKDTIFEFLRPMIERLYSKQKEVRILRL
jgi:hypothetical protein